jgi:hypothetical protein
MNKKPINENFLLDSMGTVLVGALGLIGAGYAGAFTYAAAGEAKDRLSRMYKDIKQNRLDKKLEPILKRFAKDPTIQDMYKSLPKYRDPFNAPTDEQAKEQEKLNAQHIEQAKKIADYIESQLSPKELQYAKDITSSLRKSMNESKTEKLRSIIKESIQDYIKEIDSAGTTAMYEAKMKACDEAIEKRKKKIEMAESLEEMQGMFDESKMKDLKTEIKALEKQKAKYGKMLEKLNKGKEVVTEEPMEEAPVDEADITAEMTDDTMTEGKKKKDKKDKKEMMNESFLKMQKLAGIITEAQYREKKNLVENQLEEISLSGALGKVKDKIINSSLFNKLIDMIVSKMSEKDKENFKTKFNLTEAEGGPSLEDIMSKVDAANPDKNVKEPEDLKEALDRDTLEGKIVNLIRNLTGLNLIALGGAPLGLFINFLLGVSTWGVGAFIGPVISLVASLIIHGISRKLLGMSGNQAMVGD